MAIGLGARQHTRREVMDASDGHIKASRHFSHAVAPIGSKSHWEKWLERGYLSTPLGRREYEGVFRGHGANADEARCEL